MPTNPTRWAVSNTPGQKGPRHRQFNTRISTRHVCLRVTNIDEVFAHVKSIHGVQLINDSPDHRPCLISPIEPREIELPQEVTDMAAAKEAICKTVKKIRLFYAIDRYGIQWEFEGDTPTLRFYRRRVDQLLSPRR